MKIDLELYQQIRHLKDIEGMSQRAIAKRLKISRTTVAKYCNGKYVPWERKDYSKRSSPVITQEVIDFILQCFAEDERHGIRKQKHTAHRIYERLVEEKDFNGAESSIRRTVRELRGKISEAHIPLSFDPAEAAQIDFGTAYIYLCGSKKKIKFFCMRLCYSCAIYVKAYLSENEECFLDGHIGAFEFFGGIPKRLIFDNARVAVKEGLGAYVTKETRRYKELQAHYAFTTDYCNPRKGNEKGLVENLVGLARRNFMVPMPKVDSLDELNNHLMASCQKYMKHHIQGKKHSVEDNYAHEVNALTALPLHAYAPEKTFYTSVSSYSLIAHGTNRYSVPVALVGKEVLVKLSASKTTIHYKGELVAEHQRSYDKNQKIYDIKHYMPLLQIKKRALFNAEPVKQYVPREVIDEFALRPDGRNMLLNYLQESTGTLESSSVKVLPSNLQDYDNLIQEVI